MRHILEAWQIDEIQRNARAQRRAMEARARQYAEIRESCGACHGRGCVRCNGRGSVQVRS